MCSKSVYLLLVLANVAYVYCKPGLMKPDNDIFFGANKRNQFDDKSGNDNIYFPGGSLNLQPQPTTKSPQVKPGVRDNTAFGLSGSSFQSSQSKPGSQSNPRTGGGNSGNDAFSSSQSSNSQSSTNNMGRGSSGNDFLSSSPSGNSQSNTNGGGSNSGNTFFSSAQTSNSQSKPNQGGSNSGNGFSSSSQYSNSQSTTNGGGNSFFSSSQSSNSQSNGNQGGSGNGNNIFSSSQSSNSQSNDNQGGSGNGNNIFSSSQSNSGSQSISGSSGTQGQGSSQSSNGNAFNSGSNSIGSTSNQFSNNQQPSDKNKPEHGMHNTKPVEEVPFHGTGGGLHTGEGAHHVNEPISHGGRSDHVNHEEPVVPGAEGEIKPTFTEKVVIGAKHAVDKAADLAAQTTHSIAHGIKRVIHVIAANPVYPIVRPDVVKPPHEEKVECRK